MIGLDIGSYTIKLVQLAQTGKQFSLKTAGTIPAPSKGMSSDSEKDLEMMAVAIKKLTVDCKITTRQVNASLPQSQIFSRVIQMPNLTETEIASAIKWEAEQYIPMPLSDVKMDYAILPSKEILLVAAPLTLINKYVKILEMSGLEPVSLEPEIIALARSLADDLKPPSLIINLGAKTTDLAIIRNGFLTFTRSIAAGGETLVQILSRDMGLEISQAEEYKRTYGLEEDKLEGKILISIKPVLDTIVDEIKKSLIFFNENYPSEPIKLAQLCGGTAKLPGLGLYLASSLGLETQIANPWLKVSLAQKFFSSLNEEGPIFAIACGLSMKNQL